MKVRTDTKSLSVAKQRATSRRLFLEQLEDRRMLACLVPTGSSVHYQVEHLEIVQGQESFNDYNYLYDGFHFLTVRQQKEASGGCRGETTLRPHPDRQDEDGWGGTLHAGPYFHDFSDQAVVKAVEIGSGGIHLEVEGNVPLQLSNGSVVDRGDWDFEIDISYDPQEQRVSSRNGRLDIQLDMTIEEAGKDLKLFKLATNRLTNYELQTGAIGHTGDTIDARVSYAKSGDPRDFTWDPILIPAHFPQDRSPFLSIDTRGDLNLASTWDHGHEDQINIARKPDIAVSIESLDPADTMIFGGVYTLVAAQDFTGDNVGMHALVTSGDSGSKTLSYTMSVDSVPSDQPFLKAFEAELSEPDSGEITDERDGWRLTGSGTISDSIKHLPRGTYSIDVLAKGTAAPTFEFFVEHESIGNATVNATANYATHSFNGVTIHSETTEFTAAFEPTSSGQQLIIDRVLVRRTGNLPSSPFPWQNTNLPEDVNADGTVSPIDALIVINDLNANGARELLTLPPANAAFPYLDVSGDNVVSSVDALIVINRLNGQHVADSSPASSLTLLGEGEASVGAATHFSVDGYASYVVVPSGTYGPEYYPAARVQFRPRPQFDRIWEGSAELFSAWEDTLLDEIASDVSDAVALVPL